MRFNRIDSRPDLKRFLECYWMVEDDDPTPHRKKIIPDGFVEIIFHLGDPYRIDLSGRWEKQEKKLLAGQISKHFYLENTGVSKVVGIKLKPTALTQLFGTHMLDLTDSVVELPVEMMQIESTMSKGSNFDECVSKLDDYFRALIREKELPANPVEAAVQYIFEKHGMVTVKDLCELVGVGERQLENLFKKYVGLSPKFYARLIRFNYIFELVQQNNNNWSDLAYQAAFYDQSHFIRNFKDFTGENPTDYAFDEKTMANFFLRKNKP